MYLCEPFILTRVVRTKIYTTRIYTMLAEIPRSLVYLIFQAGNTHFSQFVRITFLYMQTKIY